MDKFDLYLCVHSARTIIHILIFFFFFQMKQCKFANQPSSLSLTFQHNFVILTSKANATGPPKTVSVSQSNHIDHKCGWICQPCSPG